MSAAHVPWAPTMRERQVRRAMRFLTPLQRDICQRVMNDEPTDQYDPNDVTDALAAMKEALS